MRVNCARGRQSAGGAWETAAGRRGNWPSFVVAGCEAGSVAAALGSPVDFD